MATAITLRHPSGLVKTAYIGWSWTSFLFGGFPALFRGDILGASVYFIISLLAGFFTAGIGNMVMWFVWAAIYNKWQSGRLMERGYAPVPMSEMDAIIAAKLA